jgi:hypothetical protein
MPSTSNTESGVRDAELIHEFTDRLKSGPRCSLWSPRLGWTAGSPVGSNYSPGWHSHASDIVGAAQSSRSSLHGPKSPLGEPVICVRQTRCRGRERVDLVGQCSDAAKASHGTGCSGERPSSGISGSRLGPEGRDTDFDARSLFTLPGDPCPFGADVRVHWGATPSRSPWLGRAGWSLLIGAEVRRL